MSKILLMVNVTLAEMTRTEQRTCNSRCYSNIVVLMKVEIKQQRMVSMVRDEMVVWRWVIVLSNFKAECGAI